jgi:Flp pilus assembly protein TadD
MSEAWAAEVPRVLLELGYFCLRKGRIDDARTLLRGAEALRPTDPAPSMFLGMALFAEGQYAEAERSYRALLERHPDDDLTRAFLAEALVAQKRWAEARTLLQAVIAAGRHQAAVAFASTLAEQVERGLFQGAGSTTTRG